MKTKTSTLTGAALNWAVAMALGYDKDRAFLHGPPPHVRVMDEPNTEPDPDKSHVFDPANDWAQGGPILTREHISRTIDHSGLWIAYMGYNYSDEQQYMQCDSSELVAGLRCFVELMLGEEVEVPDELPRTL